MQHRQTRASGLQLSAAVDLVTVVRIIVESAAVYTLFVTVVIILYFQGHPAAVIPQHSLPASIGIVFSLIAIRTHIGRSESSNARGTGGLPSNSFYPTWMSDNLDGRRQLNVPITVTTVTEQHDSDMMMTTIKLRSGSLSSPVGNSDKSFPPEMRV